jgi:hypothetical protein
MALSLPPLQQKTNRVLILLVEEVGDAPVERKASVEVVACGDVETGVAGIAGEAEAVEVAVGADSGEIAGEIEVEPAVVRV